MTPEQLTQIEEELKQLPEWPWIWGHLWKVEGDEDYGPSWIGKSEEESAIRGCDGCNIAEIQIADFVSQAPQRIHDLVEEVKRIKALYEEALDVIKYYSQDETREMRDIWDKEGRFRHQVFYIFDSKKAREFLEKVK